MAGFSKNHFGVAAVADSLLPLVGAWELRGRVRIYGVYPVMVLYFCIVVVDFTR